jgi:hypothetical protein
MKKMFFITSARLVLSLKKSAILTATMLILAGTAGCNKGSNDTVDIVTPGVIPSSIDQVATVFELKYGEAAAWHYGDKVLKFTVTDVEDQLVNCAITEPMHPEEFFERTRMRAYIRVETGNRSVRLKVSSQSCWVYEYKNDDTDIQDVWSLLESWQSATNDMGESLFQRNFLWALGTGTRFEDIPCSIYMVKADPIAYQSGYNVEKSQYKFIFVITEN